MTISPNKLPADLKVFLNHVYEYKKGVRRMVLYTLNRKYESFAVARLQSQCIDFLIQPASESSINLFFRSSGMHTGYKTLDEPSSQFTLP